MNRLDNGDDHLNHEEQSEIENGHRDSIHAASASQLVGIQRVLGPNWAHPLILTSVFFGTQSVWSTEMAYASPYLHSLGLSKAVTALVFLAAPVSGLVVQPLIGALADHSTSRFGRRRPIMIAGSLLCGLSMLGLSWSTDLADSLGGSRALGIAIAVLSFYGIDFTINAVVACDRALVVDLLPSDKQEAANLWISRTTSLGALLGFFVGHLDLQSIPGIRLLGGTQFQDLSAVVSIGLLFFHLFVSFCVRERRLITDVNRSASDTSPRHPIKQYITFIRAYTLGLPQRIKMIGGILFLSWIGWFPFMFFGSLWISDIYLRQHTLEDDKSSEHERNEMATQAAAQSMMYYALVSLLTAIFLPFAVAPRQRSKGTGANDGPESHSRYLLGIRFNKLDLVTMWALSQGVFAGCLFSTIWAGTYTGATIIYAISGFSSAVLHWAPHALLGEAILDEQGTHSKDADEDTVRGPEASPLLSAGSNIEEEGPESRYSSSTRSISRPPSQGSQSHSEIKKNPGVVLGVANIAVVSPQFVIIALSAIVFAIFEPNRSVIPSSGDIARPVDEKHFDSITIIFGVGAFSTLGAMYLTWKLRKERR